MRRPSALLFLTQNMRYDVGTLEKTVSKRTVSAERVSWAEEDVVNESLSLQEVAAAEMMRATARAVTACMFLEVLGIGFSAFGVCSNTFLLE